MARLNFLPPLPTNLEEFTKEVLRRAKMRAKYAGNRNTKFNLNSVPDWFNTYMRRKDEHPDNPECFINYAVSNVLDETAYWEGW